MKEIEEKCAELIELTADFFKDKKVALVGPSAHIEGLSLGEKIDSYDLVVRINWQWPVASRLHCDYGARTDVLFHSCVPDFDTSKQLVSIDPPHLVFFEGNSEASKLINYCASHCVPCFNATSWFYQLRSRIGTYPFTGNVAADFILSTEAKELWIIGFSMHQTSTTDEYLSDGAKRYQESVASCGQPPRKIWKHDVELNCLHLKDLLSFEKAHSDLVLNDILNKSISSFSSFKRLCGSKYHAMLTSILWWFGGLKSKIRQ